jgi:hypothetical protein
MANSEKGLGGCGITCLFLVVLCLPIIGSFILTFMILADDMNFGEKVLWVILVYLLLGQRQHRVLAGYA